MTFDYSNNNGKFAIGQSELMFECYFSKASDSSIHILNDPPSIRTVAAVVLPFIIAAIYETKTSNFPSSYSYNRPQSGELYSNNNAPSSNNNSSEININNKPIIKKNVEDFSDWDKPDYCIHPVKYILQEII